MVPKQETTQSSWPWWRGGISALSALALALSAYLSWHYLAGGSVIGCNGGSACDQVLSSRWSAIAGVIPISGLAVGTYLAMLLASFFTGPNTAAPDRRLAWSAMLVLASAAAGSAIWFIIVQRWFVGAFCPYCMATHITGLLLAALVLWQSPKQLGVRLGVALPTAGLALAGILVISQLAFAPPVVSRGGTAEVDALPTLDPHAVPLVGSADAPYVITMLFDYKCPHCQKMHAMLNDVIRHYDGKVAFAMAPAPLNNKCNPYIARQVDQFKDSCELAKIGLAVWAARHDAFVPFDSWMFAPPESGQLWHPRTVEAATAKAMELVGQEKFAAAQADPWVDQYLQTSIRIFGNTILPDGSGSAVPKLVLGARWVTPEPDDADELGIIVHQSLHVPNP